MYMRQADDAVAVGALQVGLRHQRADLLGVGRRKAHVLQRTGDVGLQPLEGDQCLLVICCHAKGGADAKGTGSIGAHRRGVQCRWRQLPYHVVMDKTPGKPA
jgi:hypothetical protein